MISFTEEERDFLREMQNLGMGRAAASLCRLLGEEVIIDLPIVQLFSRREAVDHLCASLPTPCWAVGIPFREKERDGWLSGTAVLLLTNQGGVALNRDLPGANAVDAEEVVREVGHILLHACLGRLANALGRECLLDLPQVALGDPLPWLLARLRTCLPEQGMGPERRRPPEQQEAVLHLGVRFAVARLAIDGEVALFLDQTILPHLQEALRWVLSQR